MSREKSSPTEGISGVIEFRWPGRGPCRNRNLNQPRRLSRRHRVTSFNYAYDIEPEEPTWWQKLALYMETVNFQIILNFSSRENFIAVFSMSTFSQRIAFLWQIFR